MAQRTCFDFAFIPNGPISQTVEFVRLGEQLGYRCAWLPDQCFHRDPFVLLALCAQATRRIGLGLGITSPFTRRPVQIARAAAALDEASDGRFRLGLGTGNPDTVLRPLGIELKNPYGRLRDAIKIIRHLLAGERIDFDGGFDHVNGVQLDFAPRRSNLPIYIGTRGPKLLELAGQLADGLLSESLFSGDAMAYVIDHVRAGVTNSHRSLAEVDIVSWQLVQVTDNVAEEIAAQRRWIARSIKIGPRDVMIRIGIEEEVINLVNEAAGRGDWNAATACVTDDAVNRLTIIGGPSEVSRRISDVFDKGANTVSLLLLGPIDVLHNSLTRFSREIMPMFQ